MSDILEEILMQKRQEVAALKTNETLAKIMRELPRKNSSRFLSALQTEGISVIAEIKRRSPSKGELAAIPDPVALAKKYLTGGAQAISVLTDEKFFGGTLDDLMQVSRLTKQTQAAVLRKDFIIDPLQMAEAVVADADAVLLIVSALGNQLSHYLEMANVMGLGALVEVHNEAELEIAIKSNAKIIGINNRNLRNFEISLEHSFKLIQQIPKDIIAVAESGILSPQNAHACQQVGFAAVLVGEALVRSENPVGFIAQCRRGVAC